MKEAPSPEEVKQVLAEADLICEDSQVQSALDEMALRITERLAHKNPLLLAVMVGGFFKGLMDGNRNIVQVDMEGYRVNAMMVRSIPGREPQKGSWGLSYRPKILETRWIVV